MLTTLTTQLPNGLPVVAMHTPHLHSASFCLALHCGSRHDPGDLPGISHMLEHMLFRGGGALADTLAVSQAFEAAGGSLDAGTWRDHMELSATVHPERLEAALSALFDVVARPRLDAASLDIERNIVLEELRAEIDERGRDTCATNLSRRVIWAGHPLGLPILGSLQSLNRMRACDLQAHHRALFVAGNMALCVVGPEAPEAMIACVRRTMGALPVGAAIGDGRRPPVITGRHVQTVHQPGAQCTLQLTYPAPCDRGDALVAAAQVVSILDDGFTTRLPEALVHNRGWVYELDSGLDCYRDAGLFDVTLQLEPGRVAEAAAVVAATVQALGAQGPRPEELRAVHQRLVDASRFQLDDTLGLSCRGAALALFGHPVGLTEETERALACTPQAVHQAAREMFVDQPVHATVVGPGSKTLRAALMDVLVPTSQAA